MQQTNKKKPPSTKQPRKLELEASNKSVEVERGGHQEQPLQQENSSVSALRNKFQVSVKERDSESSAIYNACHVNNINDNVFY